MNESELKIALGDVVPESYLVLLRQGRLEKGYDPNTLCILNLELRSKDREGWTRDRFFLSGDDCGNYYFVSKKLEPNKVYLWSHDPLSVEECNISLQEFIRSVDQTEQISESVGDGEFVIAKTEVLGESILSPITLEELKAVCAEHSEVIYLGYREATNPFTNEVTKLDMPGYCHVICDGKKYVIHLYCGRLVGRFDIKKLPTAGEIAKKLKAKIFVSSR